MRRTVAGRPTDYRAGDLQLEGTESFAGGARVINPIFSVFRTMTAIGKNCQDAVAEKRVCRRSINDSLLPANLEPAAGVANVPKDCANAIFALNMNAVQKPDSGHPGIYDRHEKPLRIAESAVEFKRNPTDPTIANRLCFQRSRVDATLQFASDGRCRWKN